MSEICDSEGRRPCIEVVEGRGAGRRIALDRARAYVVGRLPGADVHLDDSGVSRRHLRLTVGLDAAVEAEDMRSTNGMLVNGERVTKVSLQAGDRIALGPDAVLRLSYHRPEEIAELPTPVPQVPLPPGSESPARDRVTLLIEPAERPEPTELPISPRQLEVSRLVAEGLTNAAVAERLGISPRTVTSHLDHIYARLKMGSRTALTRWIVERGLLEPAKD